MPDTAQAQDDAILRGSRFLLQAQASAGTWSGTTPHEREDTLRTCAALQAGNTTETQAAALRGYGALLLRTPQPPVALPDLLVELIAIANAAPAPVLRLRNPDGGWGAASALHSDPLDTAEAASALLTCGATPETGWQPTWNWLLANRLPDGAWDLSPEPASGRLRLTAQLLRLFHQAKRANAGWQPKFDADLIVSVNFLRATGRTDGRFSLDPDPARSVSCIDTAEALRALALYAPPAQFADSATLLRSLQQPDGSWVEPGHPEQTVFTTATVLLALLAVTPPSPPPRPDLALYPNGIQFQPTAPNPGDAITTTVILFNRGTLAAENVTVAVYVTDPRAGTPAPAAQQTVSFLAPGAAAKVSFSLNTTGMDAAPRVFAWADPAGTVQDTDRTNNLACRVVPLADLPADHAPAGVDLCVLPALVTIEDRTERTVRLGSAPALTLKAVIANLGADPAGTFLVRIRCGEQVIGRQTVAGIAAGASRLVSAPWSPVPGTHILTVEADPENGVAETDETNNRTDLELTVLGSGYDLTVKRWQDGIESDPPLAAYDTARIAATAPETGIVTELTVTGADGHPARTQPIPLAGSGYWQWNVVNQPPGTCTVQATFRAYGTGTMLYQEHRNIEVTPTVRLRRLHATLARSSVEGGEILPIPLTVNLDNGANVDSTWSLSWRVSSPAGATVLTSAAAEPVALAAAQMSRQVTLAEPVHGMINQAGLYRITVTATNPAAAEPVTTTASFTVLPALRLDVTNSVAPAELPPDNRARVRTLLTLRAVRGEADDSLPAAIGAIELSHTGEIPDRADATMTVTARKIVTSSGRRIADGSAVAVFAPYGRLSGGRPAPGDPPNPQARVYETRDGEIRFDYAPAGGILTAGQHSVTVLEFHVFLDGAERWLGPLLDTRELFLVGE